ncbi:translocation and assembly module lipoprotein TamL [Abyssalbus ytuae]|uniref:Outer membrane protein assembly factor n=1 Tax=Abyssalbus ytuae TaxID=2926907 RepID=A0A9E7D1X9_9FLAO|nr:BamA/TamA family outer membrane protein [Abyssalbus ytuae]UOB16119.1 outer membrane protein assembly factor [Abyssalbus ytuae]
MRKYIPEDELLYTGGHVKLNSDTLIKGKKKIKEELETLLRPKPNSKFLGMRLGLLAYYKTQQENPGFLYRFLNKKIGEEPVYLSDVEAPRTEELINNRLENRGFFRNEITSQETRREVTASVSYNVILKKPYVLEDYHLDSPDSVPAYEKVLQQKIDSSMTQTFLKKNMRYDLAMFKYERERIDETLKKDGYYNFNSDFLIFEVDTNQYANKKFDLFLRLKKNVPEKSKIPYKIRAVNVYPDYSVETDSIHTQATTLSEVNFFQDEEFFKPKRLLPYLLIKPGQMYDPDKSRLTSNRLASIGTYKYVNIRYKEIDDKGSDDGMGELDANIYLSPLNKRAVRAELQAVSKSNNFAGPTLSVTFTNRNLFRGGETLNITGSAGYEWQLGGGNNSNLSSTQLGLNADLIFPRLLFPIRITNQFKYAIPKTMIGVGAEYLSRSKLYSLNTFTGTFGYGWNANKYVYHELNPISINYVNLSNTTEEFNQILEDNPYLENSFQQQFIAGLTYSFIYNELVDKSKNNPVFFNANLDIAGNLLNAVSNKTNEEGKQTFLGLEFAQYAKMDIDFRYYLTLGNKTQLVSRLFAGVGLPYGNSDIMPFSKQYFSGGPYSVRAFRIRSLGPGTYDPDEDDDAGFFNQTGDVRLEANIEYRFPLYSFLKGAVFADAGNVWFLEENESYNGEGTFTSSFINELGIGAGIGLRVDIQNFVIRFDLAAPVHDPSLPEGERFNFGVDNPILNFAIGYPF